MSNIRVDVDYTIKDGTEIKFRSPVDCSQITGLIVYYPGADGNIVPKVFALSDAHGNNVGDIDHLFAEDVVVKVILDVTKGMAFVQNADTNAYLEAALAGKYPAIEDAYSPGHYYRMVDGEKEWINPPIEISDTGGVHEYRTTERYNGKPVYVHTVALGTLPDNATLYMAYNNLKMQDIVSLDTEIYSNSTKFTGPFYYLNSANLDIAIACYPMVTYGANKTNQVTMICLGSLGGYLCKYTIKYTKC